MYVKLSWRPEVDEKSHNGCTAGNVDLPDYPPLPRKMRKTNVLYYPEYPSGSWLPILAP
jgi:hypothetical protein